MSRLEESRRENRIKNWTKRTILAGEWGYVRGLRDICESRRHGELVDANYADHRALIGVSGLK